MEMLLQEEEEEEDVTALMFNPKTSDVDTSNDQERVRFEKVLGFVKADNLIRLRI